MGQQTILVPKDIEIKGGDLTSPFILGSAESKCNFNKIVKEHCWFPTLGIAPRSTLVLTPVTRLLPCTPLADGDHEILEVKVANKTNVVP